MSSPQFLRVTPLDLVLPVGEVTLMKTDQVTDMIVQIQTRSGDWYRLEGNDALEAVMLIKPSALEGKRLRWAKNAWLVHNLVGHPLMQILCFFGLYRQGIWIHEVTIPRPKFPAEGRSSSSR